MLRATIQRASFYHAISSPQESAERSRVALHYMVQAVAKDRHDDGLLMHGVIPEKQRSLLAEPFAPLGHRKPRVAEPSTKAAETRLPDSITCLVPTTCTNSYSCHKCNIPPDI